MQFNGYVWAWMTVGDSIEVVHVGVGGECMNACRELQEWLL